MKRVAVLGGGSWGSALAIVLSRSQKAHELRLWVRNPSLAESIRRERENHSYLPGQKIPERVFVSDSLAQTLESADIVISAIPAAHAREILSLAAPHLPPHSSVVSAAKGLDPNTHARMSEIISQVLPLPASERFAVLSGPSFAAEAAAGQPTAVVLASRDSSLACELQEEFAAPNFRLYTNDDVVGVELAGAMKNVIAIAAGACQGLGLGSNPLAALITRGLAEMTRLATALGARRETLSGLAGLGDLVLTCTGSQSRNRAVGIELAKGRALPDVLAGLHHMVAEGVGTAGALLQLATISGVELPITEQVNAILHHHKPPQDAIRTIMDRPLKRE
ncbi:MAG TPA: NAD(P)H-dependent glycerol-3-phosphate dehydrogenase [Candidatus Acidoferrum sp.]|nr:NAD(P)H-dependent glycerol-3-phosphate dehydrogenase [Candidatus Acidoferrum sp.]